MSSLLSVPAEVRFKIYRFVLGHDDLNRKIDSGRLFTEHSRPALDLLLTCKQLCNEFHNFYYCQTLLSCQSCINLEQRLAQNPHPIVPLKHVRIKHQTFNTESESIYQKQETLKESLRKLKHLETFAFHQDVASIYEDVPADGLEEYVDEAESIQTTVSQIFPRVKTLGLITVATDLSFLRNLNNLETLHFTGYSLSPPETLYDIMPAMRSLKSVIIDDFSAAQSLYRSSENIFGIPNYYDSFTPEVLRSLKGLRSLQFKSEYNAGFKSTYITPEMIDAACYLKSSLKSFRLRCCSSESSLEVLEALLKFLDEARVLEEVDISLGFELSISLGAPDPKWLEKMKKRHHFDTKRYGMHVETLPTIPPRAVGIRITTIGSDSETKGMDWGYSKPQQKENNNSQRWISYQLRQ